MEEEAGKFISVLGKVVTLVGLRGKHWSEVFIMNFLEHGNPIKF
jgi:hypothetical protein